MSVRLIKNSQQLGVSVLDRILDDRVICYYKKMEILLLIMLDTLLTPCGGGSGNANTSM